MRVVAATALVFLLVHLFLTFGLRTVTHRRPIFAGMIPTAVGMVLMVPNPVVLVAALALIVALEIQTRLVEEPYLLRVHGPAYGDYAARVGRFFPLIGRLR